MGSLPEISGGFIPPELVAAAVRSLPLTVEDLLHYGVPLADFVDQPVVVEFEMGCRDYSREGWIVAVIPPGGTWRIGGTTVTEPMGAVEVEHGGDDREHYSLRECWPDQTWARATVDRINAEAERCERMEDAS